MLELITHDGDYAPGARIAGAIATLMELRGGPVASRTLNELWAAEKLSTEVAVWLLEQVIDDPESSDGDKSAAVAALVANASKLFPPEKEWNYWPSFMSYQWPTHLSKDIRQGLMILTTRALLAVEPDYWRSVGTIVPVETLYHALDDDAFESAAAYVLVKLIDSGFIEPEPDLVHRIKSPNSPFNATPWYEQLVAQFDGWLQGKTGRERMDPAPAAELWPTRPDGPVGGAA